MPRSSDFPVFYADVPADHSVDFATFAELQAAGFHGGPEAEPISREPGEPPLDELVVEPGVNVAPAQTLLAEAAFPVLRDPGGTIVATWDEGRWWTPSESDAFMAALEGELDE